MDQITKVSMSSKPNAISKLELKITQKCMILYVEKKTKKFHLSNLLMLAKVTLFIESKIIYNLEWFIFLWISKDWIEKKSTLPLPI